MESKSKDSKKNTKVKGVDSKDSKKIQNLDSKNTEFLANSHNDKNTESKNANFKDSKPCIESNNIESFRAVGKLVNLENEIGESTFKGFGVAIGHTRWATHGAPTQINAHPHTATHASLVHNGIIENYKELKAELESNGVSFKSQTDTEVIVHLFEFYAREFTPEIAFKKTIERLSGSYAILLITKLEPTKIFYARLHSPLMIGINSKETLQITESNTQKPHEIYFASSDAALVGLVDKVAYINDGECGYMDIYSFNTLKNIESFKATKGAAQKDGYRFFMEKEIYEQEAVLLETMMGRVSEGKIALDELDSTFFTRFRNIAICACGTSYHSALVGKYLIERKARVRVSTHIASEFRYAKPVLDSDELFIVISQSGETADTLQALKLAKDKGLPTLAICNVDNSAMVRLADYAILTRAGIEKGVASTKAFATQVMLLWIFSVLLGIKRGKIDKIGVKSEINAMINAQKATKVDSKMHDRLKRLSRRYLHGHGFFFIGRDIFYPLALEGALKLKEISYLHAEGYPSGEMKHGPIALADSELFTLALMPKNLLYDKTKSNVEELIARDSTICAITPLEFELADDLVKIPKFNSYMEEFFSMMVILQLLALEIAIRLNRDVDMPRNLAKSVTVE
ncbi:glutamine--fructose-6-phosphate transaminase (isomerizing) [Helicobacter saguini]|uniref:Glutamine--fructose-6-phosphate aminotransferase [isomerizing] n=2 Tax=Helicobacter saguini TaxID=1548018 RepID=A0A347VU46_9HELI|nr:glutamine--fructose-6-phosphate transaminase (isomerizing) [Helicobacter saguini]MWV66301.1 glutamine--fructose-6-phosphate transaminase (isomerizing) [Helicobacter saguini]MWV68653.1 glutamine--fructose-6-phosphate transaminase (isomerizing) [Helicobacter saguini]MWV71796.1 glutamine--fructose-6-phosphate transaminase (isomerizing) [Helicobacter saguini]TLD95993.1 glutamine--fructose-6-phosphate transaminase (isomerizing) [Helicobacter saguini]